MHRLSPWVPRSCTARIPCRPGSRGWSSSGRPTRSGCRTRPAAARGARSLAWSEGRHAACTRLPSPSGRCHPSGDLRGEVLGKRGRARVLTTSAGLVVAVTRCRRRYLNHPVALAGLRVMEAEMVRAAADRAHWLLRLRALPACWPEPACEHPGSEDGGTFE